MTFEEKLGSYTQLVEARLAEILSASDDGSAAAHGKLLEAMRYGVLNGGKRLRPFLLLEAAGLFGVGAGEALNAGAAIELVHSYSLVHDDLPAMDDDDLRRGQPSVHKQFDEATAILVGDSLLTLAFEVMAREDTHESAEVRCALVKTLAVASGYLGMAGGQALDLDAENEVDLGLDQILTVQALKTGALIECSLEAGALIGGASDGERAQLREYGRAIGLAFQIADDLLDIEGDPAKLGKATGKDLALGKKTVISHLGLEGARARLIELEGEAVSALECFGARAAVLEGGARFVIRREH